METPTSHTLTAILARYPLPAPEFFQGIVEVVQHNDCGHDAYLLGEVSTTGWWYYFPIAISVKSTIPLLLLFAMGIGISAGGLAGRARSVLVPAAVLSVVLAVGMASNINIGIRHILAVYPLMALVAVAAAARQERVQASRAAFRHRGSADDLARRRVVGGASRLPALLQSDRTRPGRRSS